MSTEKDYYPTLLTYHTLNKHTYIHTYIHTYMHTCIHTYIHTCIHTYIHECLQVVTSTSPIMIAVVLFRRWQNVCGFRLQCWRTWSRVASSTLTKVIVVLYLMETNAGLHPDVDENDCGFLSPRWNELNKGERESLQESTAIIHIYIYIYTYIHTNYLEYSIH